MQYVDYQYIKGIKTRIFLVENQEQYEQIELTHNIYSIDVKNLSPANIFIFGSVRSIYIITNPKFQSFEFQDLQKALSQKNAMLACSPKEHQWLNQQTTFKFTADHTMVLVDKKYSDEQEQVQNEDFEFNTPQEKEEYLSNAPFICQKTFYSAAFQEIINDADSLNKIMQTESSQPMEYKSSPLNNTKPARPDVTKYVDYNEAVVLHGDRVAIFISTVKRNKAGKLLIPELQKILEQLNVSKYEVLMIGQTSYYYIPVDGYVVLESLKSNPNLFWRLQKANENVVSVNFKEPAKEKAPKEEREKTYEKPTEKIVESSIQSSFQKEDTDAISCTKDEKESVDSSLVQELIDKIDTMRTEIDYLTKQNELRSRENHELRSIIEKVFDPKLLNALKQLK
ncbi:Hypothetical_protein [Hexamita inflata]|uniref:Hypothetical_protein n=1 Tax=Hexamita inflata TaxID=28002 RepID=A0AA86NVP6_9EUKA|nr:Hypothetical protein HINF_LOCUS15102 [Hexamita inflata]CAI9931382.1 Hypothetical protein HINF_LOCUS19027 [Hexamita inflata]